MMPVAISRAPSQSRASYFPVPFSEADLSRLWQDQTFPPEALTTAGGERLRVIYRGRRTGGAGPDFRDALIAAPGALLRGDVELHVRSSDFRRHGHHRDAAYAGVVLHRGFRDDDCRAKELPEREATPAATGLPGGGRALVVALEGWVEGRAQEIRRWLERPALWHEPCLSAVSRDGTPGVAATLDRLGDMRFRAKAAGFARRLAGEDADEVLWQALLEALGYGGASAAFGALARAVRWAPLRADLRSLPLGERAREAYTRLAAEASGLADSDKRTRPANRADRRLQGAAALAARLVTEGLTAAFAAAMGGHTGITATQQRSATEVQNVRGLAGMLTVPGVIGQARAIEMLANALLPCLAALGPEVRARRAAALYAQLPLPVRYGAVRHLHEAVGSQVRVDFRRQQGMLYLLKQYCTQGGCGRCPLS
jgi:Protein of unknown function (DUF2851)